MDDFVSYLASEPWSTIPGNVKDATYDTREKVPDMDDIYLEATAFVNSLISYGIAPDVDDAHKLLRKVIDDYLDQACSPPPVWSSTRITKCEICAREVPLTYHHLIPRSVHVKAVKKCWHTKATINSVA